MHASWENVVEMRRDIYQGMCPRTYTLEPARMNHFPLDVKEKASGFIRKSAPDLRGKKTQLGLVAALTKEAELSKGGLGLFKALTGTKQKC